MNIRPTHAPITQALLAATAVTGMVFWLGTSSASFAATPDTAAPSAITIPDAMRTNLKVQTQPLVFSKQIPVTQGLATISAASSNQASMQVSAPADGQVAGTLPQVGQVVQAGETLFEITSAQLGAALSQWQMAQAKVTLAQQNLNRDSALFKDGLIAKKRLEATRGEAQMASAELKAAAARLKADFVSYALAGADNPEQNMGINLPVRAPITGVITQRMVMPGERVTTGQSLFDITATQDQWWLLAISPSKAPSAGQKAELKIAGCPESAPVSLMDLAVDPVSQLITLRARPKSPCPTLRPGQITTATLWLEQDKPAVSLPISALTELNDRTEVFVQRGQNYFSIPVSRKGEAGGQVFVSGSFESGDRVVTSGVSQLKALALGMGAE
ncbi:efflux RND transporter periplasmic adaptor subunit [Halothiobacillus sp.]|uniref:efflux RND transporter periplasmic adaptor subunit n=1 Tax=Halothiobacillus sp. TaxID=1891311 RepID=UPI002A3F8BEC|nr:efflux RND transporter periplasmic adaptor subunit [Halothiobacillus sp.]